MTARQAGPDPAGARTPDEFVQLLREVRSTSQLSFWEIEHRAHGLGYDLAPAVVVHALGQATLPDWQIVVGLLAACGYQGMEADRWMRVYHELAEAEQQRQQHQPRHTLDDDDEHDPVAAPPLPPMHSRETSGRARRYAIVAAAAAVVIGCGLVIANMWDRDPEMVGAPPATSLPTAPPQSTPTAQATPDGATPSPPRTTTQPPASAAQQPGVLRSGTVTLANAQGVDLDTGLSSGSLDIVAAGGTALDAAGNGKRLQLMAGMPSQQTCESLNMGQLDRDVAGLAPGQWLCVRTSSGHWGRVNITATGASLKLAYTVWS